MKSEWEFRHLGDVCEIVNGGTPKTSIDEYWSGNHRWITPAEMGKRSSLYVGDTERKITDSGLRNSSARLIPPYSVILSSRAPIGHLVINTAPMATNQGCKGLIPSPLVDYKYLYYFLSNSIELLNSLGTGATFKELSAEKLKNVPIPLAPLHEQQHIVRILDEAFGAIAIAKANTEKNLQNARALFESHLSSIFSEGGTGWQNPNRLQDITEPGSPITYGVVKPGREGDVLFIRGGDLAAGRILSDQLRTISREVSEQYRRTLLRGGELLISLVGQPGQVGVVTQNLAGANIARQVGLVRLRYPISADFVRFFLQSSVGRLALGARRTGSVQQVINLAELRKILVPVPPTTIQTQLVTTLTSFEFKIQELEIIYKRKLANFDGLKKSFLHQAFSGKL